MMSKRIALPLHQWEEILHVPTSPDVEVSVFFKGNWLDHDLNMLSRYIAMYLEHGCYPNAELDENGNFFIDNATPPAHSAQP
jgi:hypothetical protein